MDIISNRGDFLKKSGKTIVDVIRKCAIELNSKSKINKKSKYKTKKDYISAKNSLFVSSVIKLMVNSAVKNLKKENKKSKQKKDVSKEYKILDDERDINVNGGYGTVSKHYGMSPKVKYVNYDKIFSHLGNFRSKGMYENFDNGDLEIAAKNVTESSREMISKETMEKAAKHFKYFVMGDNLSDVGFIPPFGSGINSKDWEKYRLMTKMSIYQPLIKLKWATA